MIRRNLVLASIAMAAAVMAAAGAAHAAPQDLQAGMDPAATGPFAAGAAVYTGVCAACHDGGAGRAPPRFVLQQMTPETIHHALTAGAMRPQASGLSEADKVAVSQYLTQRRLGAATEPATLNLCRGARARFDRDEPPPFTGWGLDPANTHAIPARVGGLTRETAGRLKLKWAFAFPGATRARSQPAIAGGAIFVGSHNGTVYALDRATGCVRWAFHAPAEVRTTVLVSSWRAGDVTARPLAYFGDVVGDVFAVNAFTGKLVWQVRADSNPNATLTASPVLHGGRLYVPVSSLEEASAASPSYACCTFRGSILALDAATGARKWRTWLVPPPVARGADTAGVQRFGPSGVAVWGTPALDVRRGQLYVGTGDNYSRPSTAFSDSILALDLASGRIRWRYQAQEEAWNAACQFHTSGNCPEDPGPDFDFGAAPILAGDGHGRQLVLAGQKSGAVHALDPATGKLVWTRRLGRGGVVGGIEFGMAAANGRLFAPISDFPDGRTSTIPEAPGLFALDIATGDYAWRAPSADLCAGRPFCHRGIGEAISATGDLVVAGADDGHLRIYDAASGRVLWDTDTARDYPTVNGVTGHGGAIDGAAAPIVYKGQVIVGSGYGYAGKTPGNVLLVFGVE